MRGHHNPRYAPEYLERKLNPSGIAGIPVAAEVYIPHTQPTEVTTLNPALAVVSMNVPTTSGPLAPQGGTDPAPPDGSGDPPIEDPNIPIGPAGPA
jgi:hypothetical protein